MPDENAQNLAEQIARLLHSNKQESDDLLRVSLKKINARLDKIESQITFQTPQSAISNQQSVHASQQKFTNLEELADENINGLRNEKACPFEPTGKPCDDCSMCNSRGF